MSKNKIYTSTDQRIFQGNFPIETNALTLQTKVEAGDMSAYADYMGLVESRTSLDKKLANAKKEMTTAQAARFLRIQTKYLKAISKS